MAGRLEINDLIMSSYLQALKETGFTKEAEKLKQIYEVERVVIMANEGGEKK